MSAQTPDPTDPLALEQQVCFAVSVADRRLVAAYRPFLDPLGLTHPQYLVMIALWQHAPLAMRDLGRLLALDSGTLSPLLKRLEAAGLVQRYRTEADERLVTVTLTAAGRDLRDRARAVPDGIIDYLGLDTAELEALRERLTRLIAAADTGQHDHVLLTPHWRQGLEEATGD